MARRRAFRHASRALELTREVRMRELAHKAKQLLQARANGGGQCAYTRGRSFGSIYVYPEVVTRFSASPQELAVEEGRLQLRWEEQTAKNARRSRLDRELAEMERTRQARRAEEESLRAEVAAAEAEVEAARERRRQAELARKKECLEAHRSSRSAAELASEEARAAGAAARAKEDAARAQRNFERIQFRAEKLRMKKKRETKTEAVKQREAEERVRRLLSVRDRALARMGNLTDPQRILKPTAASSQPAAVESPLFPTTGYTESALMMDVRYKLGAALSNAGLARTGYARALLTSEKLIQPTRPCANSSSIKF